MQTVQGIVIHGKGYGQKLGFPTANLESTTSLEDLKKALPGVYAGTATVVSREKVYKAGIVIEPRALFAPPKIEAHLIGFSGDLYDQELRLELQAYVRPFSQFGTEQELIEQIRADITVIEKIAKLP